jgi:hypothetical protein
VTAGLAARPRVENMNVKKTLQNRVRGWFPQQPKLPKAPASINFGVEAPPQPPSQPIPAAEPMRAADGVFAAAWTFIAVFTVFTAVKTGSQLNIAFSSQFIWVFIGVAVGAVCGAKSTQLRLNRLAKGDEARSKKQIVMQTVVLGVPMLLLLVFSAFISNMLYGYDPLRLGWGFGLSLCCFPALAAIFDIGWFLQFLYERKNNVQVVLIRTSTFKGKYALIPKLNTKKPVNK